jgi:hypothetical protein
LVAAAVLAAAVLIAAVAAAPIAGGPVAAGPVAGLVTAARGLVVAAPVPAPPVAALGVAAHGLVPCTRLGVLAAALRRATGVLGTGRLGRSLLRWGLLSRSLLGRGLLSRSRLSPGPRGPSGRPAGRGRLVKAELLPGSVRADPAVRAAADARRGTVSDTGLRVCGWFHSVLLPQASRVSSRGRDTLV